MMMFAAAQASESTQINLPTVGVTLSRPQTWRVVSNTEREERVRAVEMKDKGLSEFVLEHMDKPFLVLSQDRLRSPAPSITMLIAPLDAGEDADPVAKLSRMAQSGFRAFESYTIQVPAKKCVIGGKNAAYTKATYVAPIERGAKEPMTFESWYIIRDGNYILIGAVSGNPELESLKSDIDSFINSIQFTK